MSHPFMQVYVADYTADVQHLTCEQDGAYWRILRAMWRSGGTLPFDPAKLSRICGLSVARWVKISPDVLALLTIVDGCLTQSRLLKEIENANEKSSKRSEAGKLGVAAKSLKNNNTASAIAKPLLKHLLEPEPEIEIIDTDVSKSLRARGASTAPKAKAQAYKMCPLEWEPSEADMVVGERAGLTLMALDRELAMFRDYEFKTPKSNWSAAFRNWLRRSQEMSPNGPSGPNRANGSPNRGPTVTDTRRNGAALALVRRATGQGGPDHYPPRSTGAEVIRFGGSEAD